MKIYRSLDELPVIPNAIVTQGTFDGVHVAHRTILNRLKQLAGQYGGETVVMTFDPHPRTVLFPDDHGLKLLHTLDEKIEALRNEGIQHLLILPFTREFSRLSSMQFIRDIIVNKIGTKILVIGYNHRFGKNREGSFEHLKQYAHTYGFEEKKFPNRILITYRSVLHAFAKHLKQAMLPQLPGIWEGHMPFTEQLFMEKNWDEQLVFPRPILKSRMS